MENSFTTRKRPTRANEFNSNTTRKSTDITVPYDAKTSLRAPSNNNNERRPDARKIQNDERKTAD